MSVYIASQCKYSDHINILFCSPWLFIKEDKLDGRNIKDSCFLAMLHHIWEVLPV